MVINPITITINLGGKTVQYDGNVWGFDINGVSASCSDGSCSLVMNTGVVGQCTYTGTLDNGDTFTLVVEGRGQDPGTYAITGSPSFTSGSSVGYNFSYTNNTLTITNPDPVTTTDGDLPPSGYPDP